MARPERKDVDYFPFYVKDGRTLHILEGKYECKGIGFFTNLFRFLSKRPDHHFSLQDEADKMWFFSEVKCDEESGLDMIKIMILTGKLDRELWDKYQVLASQDFLNSVKDAYKNRVNNLITLDEIREHYMVSSVRNPQDTELPKEETTQEGDVSTPDNLQTKLNYTKLKKSKGVSKVRNKLSLRDYVYIYEDDLDKISKLYSKDKLEWMFDKLDAWQGTKDKPKIINAYGYFRKGSWLIEEMEKKFALKAPEPDLKSQKERDEYSAQFTPEQLKKGGDKMIATVQGFLNKSKIPTADKKEYTKVEIEKHVRENWPTRDGKVTRQQAGEIDIFMRSVRIKT